MQFICMITQYTHMIGCFFLMFIRAVLFRECNLIVFTIKKIKDGYSIDVVDI